MLKTYAAYKDWWQLAHDKYNTKMSDDMQSDETFEEHINSMTLFELIELLEGWAE